MQTVSFWQAWGLWFDGRSVAGYQMWGLPVLWWGRIGKLGQFTGGLVAIIDIVGVARITAWGERLRARPIEGSRKTLAEAWRRRADIYRDVYRDIVDDVARRSAARKPHLYPRGGPKKRQLEPEALRVKRILWTVFGVLIAAAWALIIWSEIAGGPAPQRTEDGLAWYWWVLAIVGVIVFAFTWYWILMAVLAGFSMAANLLARAFPLVVYGLFVWPPLVLLRGPQPDRSLRVIGVLLVVAGFGLDLLAS
ncbi:hypothetical protein ACGFMK_01330 [Amycolatopsis sp. NPDC049252]|uniref:hypothetical protein n=1 Tax=Amycolatopsis sp. NPDC049252 TaxID=3363933 RepID=UPI003712C968